MSPALAASGVGVTITAAPEKVKPGETVTFTVTVTNNFDKKFDDVSVSAVGANDCNRTSLGPLDINSSTQYTCTKTAENQPGGHVVKVTATAKVSGGYKSPKGEASVRYKVKTETETPSPSPSTSQTSSSPSPSETPSRTPSHTPSPSKSKSTRTPSVSPSPMLPTTGTATPIAMLVSAAVGLVAAGSVLLILARRRRISG
jgi:LPXTG-motif cell wall-anchored protein